MRLALLALSACSVLLPARSRAADDHTIYAQRLINEMATKHPEITLLSVHAIPRGETESRIIASSDKADIGRKSRPGDLAAMQRPMAETEPSGHSVHVALPLKDGPGNVIGTLAADVTMDFAKDTDRALVRVTEIRDELATRLGSHRHLFAEYASVIRPAPFAQALVGRTMALHPEIVHLSLHVVPPGESGYRIVATEEAFRIGRKDDPDDLVALIKPDVHAIPNNRMTVCALALEDSAGEVIGMVVLQVPYSFTQDEGKVLAFGRKIRDELKGEIRSLDQLFSQAGA